MHLPLKNPGYGPGKSHPVNDIIIIIINIVVIVINNIIIIYLLLAGISTGIGVGIIRE